MPKLYKLWSFDRETKLLVVATTFDELKEKALAKFGFCDTVTLDDGTVVDESECFDIIASNSVLYVLKQGQSIMQSTKICVDKQQPVSTSATPVTLSTTPSASDAGNDSPQQEFDRGLDTPVTPRSVAKQWPIVYDLPRMPIGLATELQNASSTLSLSSATYHSVVRILYEDVLQYTLYPESRQFNAVCSALVRRYPALQDRIVFKDSNSGAGHKTWLASLRTKFKSERTKLRSDMDQTIKEAREKFGRKRMLTATDRDDDVAIASSKRCNRIEVCDGLLVEDSVSVDAHVRCMVAECAKSDPNHAAITDRMKRTMTDRRLLIKSARVDDVLQKYPALTFDLQLNEEVMLLKGVDVKSKLNAFFTADRTRLILDALAGKKGATAFLNSIGKSTNMDISNQQRQCAILLLPLLFGEHVDDWFCFNKDPKKPTPTVCARADSLDGVFDSVVILQTRLDNITVTRPQNLLDAFSSMLCLHWVFDIAYGDRLRKTLLFLASHVCKLEQQKVSVAMQRRLNILFSL